MCLTQSAAYILGMCEAAPAELGNENSSLSGTCSGEKVMRCASRIGGEAQIHRVGGAVAAEDEDGYNVIPMQPLKAHVHNGRLVLDEPTDLPEGEVVYLQPVDAVLDDEFADEERAELRQALDEGIEQMKAGQTIDVAQAMAELRAHR